MGSALETSFDVAKYGMFLLFFRTNLTCQEGSLPYQIIDYSNIFGKCFPYEVVFPEVDVYNSYGTLNLNGTHSSVFVKYSNETCGNTPSLIEHKDFFKCEESNEDGIEPYEYLTGLADDSEISHLYDQYHHYREYQLSDDCTDPTDTYPEGKYVDFYFSPECQPQGETSFQYVCGYNGLDLKFFSTPNCTGVSTKTEIATKECQTAYGLENEDKSKIIIKCASCYDTYNTTGDLCQECEKAVGYDVEDQCNSCKSNYDVENNCETCIHYFNLTDDCQSCSLAIENRNETCEGCLGNWDVNQLCNECINHYSKSTKCSECENHWTIESDCNTCLNDNFDENCEFCKENWKNVENNCTECADGYKMQSGDCVKDSGSSNNATTTSIIITSIVLASVIVAAIVFTVIVVVFVITLEKICKKKKIPKTVDTELSELPAKTTPEVTEK